MKTSASLLLLLCAAAAANNYGFKPNNQYEYRFVAKVMTGIPEISSQYSGMGLRATLLVQAPAANVLQFKLRDTEMAELRNKQVELSWHESVPLHWQPVTEVKQLLEQPFIVKLQNGKIVDLIVGGNEPENMVNIKKAIVQRWQMTMDKEIVSEFPTGKFFEDVKQPLYFEAEEQSIGGLCLTGYTVTPILEPQTQLETIKTFGVNVMGDWSWTEQSVPKEVKKPRFLITKNIFHDKCKRRNMFQSMSPAPITCRENVTDCFNTQANTTTMVRYLVRGNRKAFEIEAVNSESIHAMYPYQAATEQIITDTNQTLILLATRPVTSPFPDPPQKRELKLISWAVSIRDTITPEKEFLAKPTLTDAPVFNMARPVVPLHRLLEKVPATELKKKVLDVLASLDSSFDQVPDPTTRDTPGMVNVLHSLLNMMSLADLEDIYSKISTIPDRNVDVMKKLFREAVAMGGTNPCIMMVKKWIETKQVVGAEAATLVMFIPMHIKTPTVEILQEMFKTLSNGIAQNDEHLRQNSMLAFAKTVNIACIRRATTTNAFPVTMFQKFCSLETQQIEQQWIPFFKKRLTEDISIREKMVVLKALATLQHPAVVPTLMEIATKKDENVHVRETAIYAMMKFREINPTVVEEVVKPIAFDRNEFHEVRMAATTVLITLNPSLATYQTLAMHTWVESDQQITNYISSFLEQAANLTDINVPWVWEIREKARSVFRLTRPMLHADLFTKNILVRSQIDLLMVTAEMDTVINKSPFDVSSLTYRGHMRSYNSLTFFPIQMFSKFVGLQNVIDFLMAPDSTTNINRFNRGSEPLQAAIGELAEIKNLLKMVKRENEPLMVWLQANIMGSMERLFAFDQQAIQNTLQQMRDADTKKYEVKNFQKIMNLVDHVIGLPTDVGVPMMVIRSAPAVLSIRGDVVFESKKSADGSRLIKLDTKNLQPFINVKMLSLAGAVNPLTMRFLSAGVSRNIMMSLPLTTSTEWDTKSNRVEVFAKFINKPSELNLLRMETYPFTSALDLTKMTTTMRQNSDTKPIHVKTPTTTEMRLGKAMFGIDMTMTVKSEDDFGDIWSFFRKISATSKLGNMFTVLPTIRPNLMKLTLDTATATTQKMIISVAKDDFARYHTLDTVNNPEAEPVEHIEWLADKAQYRDEKHAAIEKDARREVMKRSRRVLQDIHTGNVLGYTVVVSAMGMKEKRMALKTMLVKDASRLNTKVDARLLMVPTDDVPIKRELIVNGHITWPHVGRTLNELLASNMIAPMEMTINVGINDTMTRVATVNGLLRQTDLYKMYANQNRVVRDCREMRNNGFEHAPVCEMAKIKASRMNQAKITVDMNTHLKDELTSVGLLGKESLTKKMDYDSPSWMELIGNYFLNRLASFPKTMWPSKLHSMNQRSIQLEFNPFSKCWKLMYDDAKTIFKIKKIHAMEFPWKSNGVYNTNNNFGLSIPFMPFLNIKEGINAYEDSWEMRNRKMMGINMHKCVIDEHFIKTFDNVTLPEKMVDSCWHLMAKDCSEVTKLAILVKQVGSRRAVRIITSTRIIELMPTGLDYHLRVDNQETRRLPIGDLVVIESETADKHPEARILKWTGELLELELPQYQARVRIVGPAVKLMLEPMFLRNRVCGLCGDMNGESSQDLVGPKRCLFFSAREFQAAYMVDKTCQRDPLPNYGDDCVKVKRESWML
ncbi:vitellogenin-like isoform X1 [Amphibalanus amphitrite]|uniref:vitellogenin-like isoform X1 n=1 Tax=Amphibalanus amphitrite TaxID=1232801 RepID=UPI001C90381B|nr:vitellogenin-like isoform X1 [Amphibalanus amphitrite]